jgi:hypothetical protein
VRENALRALSNLETTRDTLIAQIRETVARYRAMPDQICALERDFAVCLNQIHQQKVRLGLAR